MSESLIPDLNTVQAERKHQRRCKRELSQRGGATIIMKTG